MDQLGQGRRFLQRRQILPLQGCSLAEWGIPFELRGARYGRHPELVGRELGEGHAFSTTWARTEQDYPPGSCPGIQTQVADDEAVPAAEVETFPFAVEPVRIVQIGAELALNPGEGQ